MNCVTGPDEDATDMQSIFTVVFRGKCNRCNDDSSHESEKLMTVKLSVTVAARAIPVFIRAWPRLFHQRP